jgi:hypothetical protein
MPRSSGGPLRVALTALDAFVAIAAVGGGLALLLGLEGDRFPTAWLTGTPFDTYALPGLVLSVLVGGSAAVATIVLLRSPRTGGLASLLAGLVLAAWIVGEILIVTADGEVVSPMEALFLAAGVAMTILGYATMRGAGLTGSQPGRGPRSADEAAGAVR